VYRNMEAEIRLTCGAQLLQSDHGEEEVLIVQVWVERHSVGLLHSAAEAVGPGKELVEAAGGVSGWAGVCATSLSGEESMTLHEKNSVGFRIVLDTDLDDSFQSFHHLDCVSSCKTECVSCCKPEAFQKPKKAAYVTPPTKCSLTVKAQFYDSKPSKQCEPSA
jgi:hypothetical protein